METTHVQAGAKQKLVVLGTGFGAVRLIRSVDTRFCDVTVVSPRNYFLFTPLLASTAVGTIEFRSIVEPIRVARDTIQYYQATCTAIDPAAKTVSCESASGGEPFAVSYDKLVIAVGATTATFGVPGVRENCLFLKDIPDARSIRAKIIQCFERANEPALSREKRKMCLHFVIVGGGPTGVEFAGELHDLVFYDLSKRYKALAAGVQITVLEASDRILGAFDSSLSSYTARTFKQRKIDIQTRSPVAAVGRDEISLRDGTVIKAGFILWSAGIAPTPFVEALPFEKHGWQLLTDEYLAVPGQPEIYAIGDCATVRGRFFPATGQLAQQQGKYLAKTFNAAAENKHRKPFGYLNLGMLAYVGGGRALMDAPHLTGRGFVAWLLWRSIYLTKLVSLRNKVSVLFDWVRTTFFGREFSKF